MQDSQENPYIVAHVEEYSNYDIIWYEWKYDGPPAVGKLFNLPDFEPVIILYKDNKITCVIVRNAWNYIPSSIKDENLILPPHIVFETDYHHPLVKTQNNEDDFNKKISSLMTKSDYDVNTINASAISPKFRIGTGHPTKIKKFWQNIVDPKDYADQAYAYYSESP